MNFLEAYEEMEAGLTVRLKEDCYRLVDGKIFGVNSPCDNPLLSLWFSRSWEETNMRIIAIVSQEWEICPPTKSEE